MASGGCKEAAKSVGDVGNDLFKTADDTINRDKVNKDKD